MAMERLAGQHVRGDRRRLSRAHVGELVLLEIGVDPEALRRHDRDELRADGRVGAGPRAAIADRAIDRRAELGVVEVEFGDVAVGDGAGERGFGLLLLRVDDVELAARRLQGGAAALARGDRLLVAASAFWKVWSEALPLPASWR